MTEGADMAEADGKVIITCRNLHVAYDRDDVLHDVNLDIHAGVLLPFVGPNGAGKTTLLRTFLGLLKPTRGRLETPFAVQPPGYVPQQKALDPLFPVSLRDIVIMGLYPQLGPWRRPDAAQRELLDQTLARFSLKEHENKMFAELSGGMRQKTLLARAFVSGADVFIMDEPTSELDEESEAELLRHLYRLCAENGKTVLLAHHGLNHIASLAKTVCRIEHGRAWLEDVGGCV